jgi:Prealbumin-like fold domain
MTRIVGPAGSPRRRRFLFLPALLIAAASLFFVASSGAVLGGSSFEAQDGDLAVNDGGTHDWNTPVETINCGTAAQIPHEGTNCSTDLTKSTSDNAFGQGSKEDLPNPSVVSGSIPPNKSDLTRFYINKETGSNGHHFLYMAWERSNVLGSANMDFEFNRNQCVVGGAHNTCDPNGVTPVRVNGDLLVTYDFANGGSRPSLHTLRWLDPNSGTGVDPYTGNAYGTGKNLQCFSANAYPCWGDSKDITAAGLSEGAINTGNVVDTNPPLSGPTPQTTLAGLTFGEAGLDLENIGVFQTGKCATFGSAYLKSRSSDSFPAETKDFVAPIAVDISNCGTLIVKKVTDPAGDPQSFGFTVDGPNPPNTSLPKTFSLVDQGTNSTQVFSGGGYSVAETVPTDWALTSASCDNGSGSLSGSTISNITVAVDETVTCTFNDQKHLGAIRVTKQSSKDSSNLNGATFTVVGGSVNTTLTTGSGSNAAGTACIDHLPWGTYTVTETGAPSGYKIDNPTGVSVDVDHNADCAGNGTPNAPATFTDTPLSKITVSFESLAAGNPTSATIECSTADGSSDGIVGPPPVNLPEGTPRVLGNGTSGLTPGHYDCEVVVDP